MELTNCQTIAKSKISKFLNNDLGNNIFLLKDQPEQVKAL